MNKKTLFHLALILMALVTVTSCKEEKSKGGKSRSIGNSSEILVVVQNETQWDNDIGKALKNYFGALQYGLPQDEPVYKLSHVKVSSFNDMFQKHRNIIIVNIDPKAKKAVAEFSKDLWAKPQRVFKITAPSVSEFVKVFNANKKRMFDEFNAAEHERILTVFRPNNDVKVVEQVIKKFGLKMVIPKGFFVAKSVPGLMWIRKETLSSSQGIIIISVPYTDTLQFSLKSIMSRTDEFLRKYIPGPTEGSWMTTDKKNIPPRATVINDFFTDYAVEVRGLWRVEHDFMGGPFESITFVDWRKNQIVTMFAYVYNPNKKKRDLLKQLEAMMYSARFADAK